MKRPFSGSIIVLIMLVLNGCGQVDFELSNGKQASLKELKDRWVIINYWATWCKPCIEEIPELNQLNQRDGMVVFGVNFDGIQGSELVAEAGKIGIEYDMIIEDPFEQIQIDRPMALPATVLIDGRGVTRSVLYGPQTEQTITDKLAELQTN